MKSIKLVLSLAGFLLLSIYGFIVLSPSVANAESSLQKQISDSVLWYAQYKQISSEQVSPQVTQFLNSYFQFMESERNSEFNESVQPEKELRLSGLLNEYDKLIKSSGSDDKTREFELKALSFAIQDPMSSKDDEGRLRFLNRFHTLITTHYAKIAEAETSRAKIEPYKINPNDVIKAIGTYSIYGFFLSAAYHFWSGEYNTMSLLSEPVLTRMGIVSAAAGPFSVFNQLFLQTYARIEATIKNWKVRRAAMKATKTGECHQHFK